MRKQFFNDFRYLSWIVILCSMLGSMLLIMIGAYKAYSAFDVFAFNAVPPTELMHLDKADIAISYLIKSLDTFLVALVLFIFSHGVFTLFLWDKHGEKDQVVDVLNWIKTPNIGHLKNKLAEVIIVILFVKFLELVLINFDKLSWEIMVLPASILMLSVGLKVLGLGHSEEGGD